jgi:hypothetical protein
MIQQNRPCGQQNPPLQQTGYVEGQHLFVRQHEVDAGQQLARTVVELICVREQQFCVVSPPQ